MFGGPAVDFAGGVHRYMRIHLKGGISVGTVIIKIIINIITGGKGR